MRNSSHLFPKQFSSYEHTILLNDSEVVPERSSSVLLSQCSDLLGLIEEWIKNDQNSLLITPAAADDSEDLIGISIILQRGQQSIHAVYLTYAEIKEVYPDVPVLNDFASLYQKSYTGVGDMHYIELDEDRLAEALGFSHDSLQDRDLGMPLLSPDQALRYCLCYALSGSGEATISLMSSEKLVELELDRQRFRERPLFFVGLSYVWKEKTKGTRAGISEMLYFQGSA
jgi:hypothetical protein